MMLEAGCGREERDGLRQLSPTDISQFIRLEQCERYLRLRLHERAYGSGFLRDIDVAPQAIPPLLTRSGERFEAATERQIGERFRTVHAADGWGSGADDHHALVCAQARDLPPGETVVLFQPCLRVEVAGWRLVGVLDILRLSVADLSCTLEEAMAMSSLREGDRVIVAPRVLPPEGEGREPSTPTPSQLLYAQRATLLAIDIERDAGGRPIQAMLSLELAQGFGGQWSRGFLFFGRERPFIEGQAYTVDEDPNNITGYWCLKVVDGIRAGGTHAIYARMEGRGADVADWPARAAAGQAAFLHGLDALHQAGVLVDFEPDKHVYIGEVGDRATLLVQGPPGTGKSFTTAFAVLARLQGAMATGREYRVLLSCKTHAATDVLLEQLAGALALLRDRRAAHPEVFDAHIDPRLFETALFRALPRGEPVAGVLSLRKKDEREDGTPALRAVEAARWCVVAGTPGGLYTLVKEGYTNLFGHALCDCLVLDEASQMNLPEALLAGLLLRPGGQLIVVGDHRQMPPIVKHEWSAEPRRTFQDYRTYESLFAVTQRLGPRMIKFRESFRLHRDMAEFLRQEIYQRDGIPFFSRRRDTLPPVAHDDQYLAAVLAPDHPIVVVEHGEAASQVRNPYEQALVMPLLAALVDRNTYALDTVQGLGVVVPHRAQRAALQEALPALLARMSLVSEGAGAAVDTVERFQGDEREVVVISAAESDREYLVRAGEFLYDPRRLTVALSRARCKLVLVASSAAFSLFSADEEIFANAQLWKDLLHRTCTVLLWRGERDGYPVAVWGNAPIDRDAALDTAGSHATAVL